MSKIKIAFFGSSTFSIPTLKNLLQDDDISVECVITMPPAVKNRGQKQSNNIVYDFAIQNGISRNNIFIPHTLKNNIELVEILHNKQLDFIVVVAYGKIITKDIINLPKFEILNLHPSALPKYRGAAPIERAIENGEKELDICIMRVDIGLDTGDVAMREKYKLLKQKHASDVIPEIAEKGAKMMIDVIKNIYHHNSDGAVNDGKNENTDHKNDNKINSNNHKKTDSNDKSGSENCNKFDDQARKKIIFEKQSEIGMIYAPKIEKNELFIDINNDCNLTAESVYNKIRAFNACGGCYFIINNQRIKILRAKLIKNNDIKNNINKNSFKTAQLIFNKKKICISFVNGIIIPEILQKEGKKPMNLKDFLNGIK